MTLCLRTLILSVACLRLTALAKHTYVVPPSPFSGPSTAQFSYTGQNLEAPQVSPINSTSFEWWYFDGVSSPDPDTGNQSSVVIVFYTATPGGFDLLAGPDDEDLSVTLVDLTINYAIGTRFAIGLNESQATFVSFETCLGQGLDAYYDGSNAFFHINHDLTQASVHIAAPEQGVVGTFHLHSIAPPHLPCGPLQLNSSLQPIDNLGWFNGIPDAHARGDFIVFGEEFNFGGNGYHDKDWGVQPLHTLAQSWYWGHARLGEYSIVWADLVGPTGVETSTGYIAKDGQIIIAACGGTVVRPFGGDDGTVFPPHINGTPPDGFTIQIDSSQGTLLANVSATDIVSGGEGTPYVRWAGIIEGSFGDEECLDGPAFYEQLTFIP